MLGVGENQEKVNIGSLQKAENQLPKVVFGFGASHGKVEIWGKQVNGTENRFI